MTASGLAQLLEESGLGDAAVHVRSLDADCGWSVDDGRWRYPASMIKVPLAVAAAAAVEEGRLAWDAAVRVETGDMTTNDAPSPLGPSVSVSLREAVTLALQRSDNVATNVLIDVLDRDRATASLHALGFRDTYVRRKLSGSLPLIDDPAATGRNSFPACEAAALFAAIARDEVPAAPLLRDILAVSWWDVKLSRGLQPSDRFAHKTGDTDEVTHDGGILTLAGGARWVLVVYTALPSSEEHHLRFGTFMRALRPHLDTPREGAASLRSAGDTLPVKE